MAAGGQGALATDAPPLALGQAAPDAELLAVGQGVLEAGLTHDAAPAHLLGLPGGRPALGEEEVGVDTEAVRLVLPGSVVRFAAYPHRCWPPCSSANRAARLARERSGYHSCNYNDVIVSRSFAIAQGGMRSTARDQARIRADPLGDC